MKVAAMTISWPDGMLGKTAAGVRARIVARLEDMFRNSISRVLLRTSTNARTK